MILSKVRKCAFLGDSLFFRIGNGGVIRSFVRRLGSDQYSANWAVAKSPYNDIKLPDCTLPEFIWEKVDRWADRPAMECSVTGRTCSYGQLRTMASKFAASLIRMGLRPMDVVTIILPNVPEFPIAVLGVIEAGLIASPASALYSVDEICFQISDSNSKCIVTNSALLPKVLEAKNKLQKSIYAICVDNSTEISNVSNIIHFSDLVFQKLDNSFAQRAGQRINLDDTAFLLYSSGTTGLPKGVHHTHRTLSASIEQVSQPELSYIGETAGEHQNVVSGMLPFAHIYSLCVVLLHSLRKGAKVVTIPKFNSETFLKLLEKYKDISLHVVPSVIHFLGSHPSVKQAHLKNIKFIQTGGAPCSDLDIERIKEQCEISITQVYGMTEASALVISPVNYKNYSSLGAAISNTSGKVVSENNPNKILPFGEVGELCFKGPQVMKGYHNQPSATAYTIDKDGWIHTGDLGYIKDGNFYVIDRLKELIKVKGFQVAPAELESVLRQHPDILDVGVTGIPSIYAGEKPVAFVVTKPDSRRFNPSDFMEFVSKKVASYKQLANVVKLDKIPRSHSGKILRKDLKQLAKEMASNKRLQ